mmetsp:Transcript_6043/g.24967  ORF Transcript_6043/g.24967 Transcript_6043/m.24967 type:complete len:242 (+) Transcript_6043:988-1713(+)
MPGSRVRASPGRGGGGVEQSLASLESTKPAARGAARHRGHGKRGEGLHPPRRDADVAEGGRDIGLGADTRAALRPAVAAGPADANASRRVFSAVGHSHRAGGVPSRVAAAGAHAIGWWSTCVRVRVRSPRVPRADQPVDGVVQGVARAFPRGAAAVARHANRGRAGAVRGSRRGSQRRVRPVPGRRDTGQPAVGSKRRGGFGRCEPRLGRRRGRSRQHRRGEGGERFGKDFRSARARRGGE